MLPSQSDPMVGLLKADAKAAQMRDEAMGGPQSFSVVKGAATHSLAFLLTALQEDGWRLHRPCPGCCNCAPSNYTDPMCDGSGER